MIPRLRLRTRLRLALAIVRGTVYVDHVESRSWGQIIRLRTIDDVEIVKEGEL